jgi:hypothetical protein
MSDNTIFPKIFGLGGTTFEHVFTTNKEFVDFTITNMGSATGIFKVWKNYVIQKVNNHKNGSENQQAVKNVLDQ